MIRAGSVVHTLATVTTGSYSWTAVAESEEAANVALIEAYDRHVVQMLGDADPELMRELIEEGEVDYFPIQLGTVLRDGSPI